MFIFDVFWGSLGTNIFSRKYYSNQATFQTILPFLMTMIPYAF